MQRLYPNRELELYSKSMTAGPFSVERVLGAVALYDDLRLGMVLHPDRCDQEQTMSLGKQAKPLSKGLLEAVLGYLAKDP